MRVFTALLGMVTLLTGAPLAGWAADAGDFVFTANANGSQEVPAVNSTASGKVLITFKRDLSSAEIHVIVRGLHGTVAAAHLHCGAAGLNGPVTVPFDLSATGTGGVVEIDTVITNANVGAVTCASPSGSDPNASKVNNIASLWAAMRRGEIYFNAHTSMFASGEVRGQLVD